MIRRHSGAAGLSTRIGRQGMIPKTDETGAPERTAHPVFRNVEATVQAGLSGTGVSAGMRAVLEVVFRNGPMSMAEIAERLLLSRRFVRRMCVQAAHAGLLEAVPNPASRDAHFLQVTQRGGRIIERIRDNERKHLKAAATGVPREDAVTHVRIYKALDMFFAGVSG